MSGIAKLRTCWRRRRESSLARRHFDAASLRALHETNYRLISAVQRWLPDDALRDSVFRYGIPEELDRLIDCDVGSGISYTDALAYLALTLKTPVRYLELGVSVGKNFWPMIHHLGNGRAIAFDIEEMAPVLRPLLRPQTVRKWTTIPGSMKKSASSLSECAPEGISAKVSYLSADVFDDASWAQLQGEKFNLIFSDAFHSGEALRREHEMLSKHSLFDNDELIMVWDDLGGEMTEAFDEICRSLSQARAAHRNEHFIAPFRGWLGDNWDLHQVGFFLSYRG